MNNVLRAACTVLGASFALTLSGAAAAQTASPKIIIDNVTPKVEIPLVTASQVQFLSNGDLSVQCRLNGSACPGIGGGTTNGTPPAAFALTASPTTVNSGVAFSLTWNSSDSEACYAVAPTSISGWTSGNRVLANSGNVSLTLTNTAVDAVTHTFQIRCFNADGSRTVSSAAVTINGGGQPNPQPTGNYCQEYYGSNMPTSANFTAHGLTRADADFGGIWSGIAPGGTDGLRGVPGPRLSPAAGRYLAIPFVMTTDTPDAEGSFFRAVWNQSQLADTPSGAVTVTVSPCPGDFRPSAGFGSNPNDFYSTNLCRGVFGNTGAISVSSTSSTTACYAPKNKQMYINIATYNMYNSTLPANTTCTGGDTFCGVMMRMD